jgi:transposase InsO family protein
MCRLLDVARSSFYAWRNRTETPTQARRRELAECIKKTFDDSRQTSGCRRVAAQLNRDGHECSVGLVADLMRELGLRAVSSRRKAMRPMWDSPKIVKASVMPLPVGQR